MNYFFRGIAVLTCAAAATLPAVAAEATFERNLTVNGTPDLTISTGAGAVHLSAGPAGQIHIVGRVHSDWGGGDDSVRDIAAHPPIQQTGNIVRIGHQNNLQHVSIDYEIQAPAGSYLDAATGAGDLTVDGVGDNAKLATGSGPIHATGLHGSFSVETGSGSIYAEQMGTGDVRAETGSGSVELRNLDGALRVQTGMGSVKIAGKPVGPWKIQTGAGSVEIWPGNAAFSLDAECGAGSIHSDRDVVTQGSSDHHRLEGKVNGGGPLVHIETGAGSIRIH
jgi:Putative adhesin